MDRLSLEASTLGIAHKYVTSAFQRNPVEILAWLVVNADPQSFMCNTCAESSASSRNQYLGTFIK